jgi:uncharacterized RDD family membrane protein YckC
MTTPSDPTPQPAPATPITYWEAPKEEAGPAPGVKFAGHGARLVSYILDSLIVGAIFIVVLIVGSAGLIGGARLGDFDSGLPSGAAATIAFGLFGLLLFLLTFVLAVAYFPFFWVRSGQTPGMRPFGLYVVRDSDGGKISLGQAVLRLIGMWVSAIPLYLGFIWIFIDPRRRGWHDLIAGTVVVERTPPA